MCKDIKRQNSYFKESLEFNNKTLNTDINNIPYQANETKTYNHNIDLTLTTALKSKQQNYYY